MRDKSNTAGIGAIGEGCRLDSAPLAGSIEEECQRLWGEAGPPIHAGNPPAAEPALRRLVALKPSDAEAHFYLGQIEYQRNELASAAEHFRLAEEFGVSAWPVKYYSASCDWQVGNHEQAVRAFRDVISEIPADLFPAERFAARVLSTAMDGQVSGALWCEVLGFLATSRPVPEWCDFVGRCGYHFGAPRGHNARLFEHLVIPLIRIALDRDQFHGAIELSLASLYAVALDPHNQDQWSWCFTQTNPLFAAAGERYRETSLPVATDNEPVVAVVVDQAISGGSGLIMLLNILEQISPAKRPGFSTRVYSMQVPSADLLSKCRELRIPVVSFGKLVAADFSKEKLLAMRMQAHREGVSVAVYASTFEGFVCLASAIGLAPVQVYLTMGFHSLDTPRIDAYLACGSFAKGRRVIAGRPWQTLPFPFPNPYPADGSDEYRELMAKAMAIRAEFSGKTILGSLARPEKLDASFIDAVSEILRCNPDTVFLWFGYEDTRSVRKIASELERRCLVDRCSFRGWVDAKIYAHVLDVHLDCFGLPTGITMAQTFSAGTAYVLIRGVESSHIGMTAILSSICDSSSTDLDSRAARELFLDEEYGESLMMVADNIDDYIAMANRLIEDAGYRKKVGAAAKRFMSTYFHESNHMGKIFSEIIFEAIAKSGEALRGVAQKLLSAS